MVINPTEIQLELIQKISKTDFLDQEQSDLANHVRNCKFCLHLLEKAGLECEKHYGKKKI